MALPPRRLLDDLGDFLLVGQHGYVATTTLQQAASSPPRWGGELGLDGLGEDPIETLDEDGRVFDGDAFEEEGLVEK
jgi:hypothetical protein